MDLLLNPEVWVAFLTLLALEIVLGIDNMVFISIFVDKLPQQRQALAPAGARHGASPVSGSREAHEMVFRIETPVPLGWHKGKETGTGPDDDHYLRARLQVRNRSARAR